MPAAFWYLLAAAVLLAALAVSHWGRKLLLGAGALLLILGAALGASMSSSSPQPWQPYAQLEYTLPTRVDAPAAEHSARAALNAALHGWLTQQRFRLAEFEAGDQDRCVAALRAVDALVAEARPVHGEAIELAAGIDGEVEADRADPVAAVEALAACGDPLLGLRAVALQLGVSPSPWMEVEERIEQVEQAIQDAGEVFERLRPAKKRQREKAA